MAGLVRFAYTMALRRVATSWRMEAVLFGSILLAVTLLASGVIFSDMLANAALQGALGQAAPEEANFRVRTFSSRDDPLDIEGRRQAFNAREQFVQQEVVAPFAPYLREHAHFLETATFFYQGHPQLELHKDHRPRGPFVSLPGLTDRIRVLEGQWPGELGATGQPLEVAVDRLGADLLQLGVDDVMEAYPATSFADSPPMEVRISAIFEAVDPSEEFWYGLSYAFSRKDERWTLVPLFTEESLLIDHVLGAYPSLYTDTTWHFFPDKKKMRANEVGEVQAILTGIERATSVGLKNSSSSIRLDNLLNSYEEQLLLARLPLFLLLFLVVGILVFYLALIAGLVVRSRAGEIAMLKSRGATVWQLGLLGLGEGLFLALPAAIAGPLLALGLVKLLGFFFFDVQSDSDALLGVAVEITAGSVYLGIAGGSLAVVVFTAATLAASRHGSVEARESWARPPTVSFLHRYYLDVALLALIGLLWWQLQNQGTFLVQSLGSRELSINYTLLLGPALGLLAAGLIVLRLFPLAAAIVARVVGPVGPSWLVHVLRHLSRDPMTPAMLIVLVMLATALGVMGSAFSSTLERGQRERALYMAGADIRLQHASWNRPAGSASDSNVLGDAGSVKSFADVFRSPGYLTTTGFSTSSTLLAVDANTIDQVAWFREDFAGGLTLQGLSRVLRGGPENNMTSDGIRLPADAAALTLWVRAGSSGQGVGIWARLRDAEGRIADEWLGDLRDTQWSRLQLQLRVDAENQGTRRVQTEVGNLSPPLELISFSVRSRFSENFGGAVFLGRVEASTPDGEFTLHDFRSTEGWQVIEDFRRPGLYSLETSRAAVSDNFEVSSRFSWASGGVGLTGLRAGAPDEPIPALVSGEFLKVADAEIGDTIILSMSSYSLLLKVVAKVDFFPTLDPGDRPFAVVDLSRLNQGAVRYSPLPPRGSNELWLAETDGSLGEEFVRTALRDEGVSVRKVFDATAMVAQRVEQPLVNSGWGALLVLLFIAMALASASGLLLFSHLDAQERRTEFALLRTLGISRSQMQQIVWTNLFLVVISGVGLGTLLGWLLGLGLLPLMEVVEEGARATPSLVLTANWSSLLVSYVVLAAVGVMCGLWLTWLTNRLQLQQVLRMGE